MSKNDLLNEMNPKGSLPGTGTQVDPKKGGPGSGRHKGGSIKHTENASYISKPSTGESNPYDISHTSPKADNKGIQQHMDNYTETNGKSPEEINSKAKLNALNSKTQQAWKDYSTTRGGLGKDNPATIQKELDYNHAARDEQDHRYNHLDKYGKDSLK